MPPRTHGLCKGHCFHDLIKAEDQIVIKDYRRIRAAGHLHQPGTCQGSRMPEVRLRRRGWAEAELGRRRKGDPQKVELAWALRARTTMTRLKA